MSSSQPAITPGKRVLAVALCGAVFISISLPHVFLPMAEAMLVAGIISLAYSVGLGILLREGGSKVQIGIGGTLFVSLVLSSACVGVFFHLPLKAALLWSIILFLGGTLLVGSISAILCVKAFPDRTDEPGDDQGDAPHMPDTID